MHSIKWNGWCRTYTASHHCIQYRIDRMVDGHCVSSCLCLLYRNSKAKVMLVDDVLVLEEQRGQGYGKELMNEVVDLAKRDNVDSIELTVNDDNLIARSLYSKTGFEETTKKYCRRILNIK